MRYAVCVITFNPVLILINAQISRNAYKQCIESMETKTTEIMEKISISILKFYAKNSFIYRVIK